MVTRKAKSNSTITHAISEDGNVLTFTVLGAGSFTFDRTKVNPILTDRAEIHGWLQRISDGGAMSRNPDTGLPATADEKMARMARIAQHYEAGATEWGIKATGGVARGPDAGLIVLAICRSLTNGNIDEANIVVDKLAAKRGIDRAAALRVFAGTDKVLAEIAKIKGERAPSGADELLAELND